jgi:hypothetical protein
MIQTKLISWAYFIKEQAGYAFRGMPDSITTIFRDDVHPDAPHYGELVVVLK